MLTYSFENRGSDSLYEHLYKQIKADILEFRLSPNEKLPSKRALAKHLNISVITVEGAYNQLLAEGYIYSQPKSGYYVSALNTSPSRKSENFVPPPKRIFRRCICGFCRRSQREKRISF